MIEDVTKRDAESPEGTVMVVESAPVDADQGDRIEEPAKLLRIASMTRSMLEEVRTATLDEEGRVRLRAVFDASLEQLHNVLTEDLRAEFPRFRQPPQVAVVARVDAGGRHVVAVEDAVERIRQVKLLRSGLASRQVQRQVGIAHRRIAPGEHRCLAFEISDVELRILHIVPTWSGRPP